MKISAIIVTYNGEKWIRNCLISIQNSVVKVNIIIVDNASSDSTTSIIENEFSNIDLLKLNENIGFGRANNIGIKKAYDFNSDYFLLINQDVVIKENTIKTLLEVAKKNQDYGIISPIHLTGNGSNIDLSCLYYLKNQYRNELLSDFILKKILKDVYEVSMINAAFWFIPRSTIEIVGGFDPMFFMYGEDDNYCQRVRYHNFKIGITLNTEIFHFSSNHYLIESEIGSKEYLEKYLNRIKVEYGNVNSKRYKEIKFLIRNLIFKIIYSVFNMNFNLVKLYIKKIKHIRILELKKKVFKNRETGLTHLKEESK